MVDRVAILGCGYIGIELGRQLTAAGYDVVGVRRSESGCAAIEDAGFEAHQADLTDPEAVSNLPDAEWVVFAASSGGRDAEAAQRIYVEALDSVIESYGERESPPDRLVYTSSTGVYGDHDGEFVDESTPLDPTTEKTRVLVEAERIARERSAEYGIDGTVARFSGLYGPNRYRLERYLEGPVTEGYLNMVHREDAAGAVGYLLIADRARDGVVLVTDDEPADKWTFADWLANECGVGNPPKETKQQRLTDDELSEAARRRILTSKRCSNGYLRELGYDLRYPTFREGYRAAVDAYRSENIE
ncbi:nucleoside-diphosphate-sugar epimerase [Halohasta litchfieldiae]|jgi:nucleoside-diphosphate-sugar epimerase|uniref:Nucleoside-diphosphate-sugar epimerase n=1 Tax=Halohasta litchfieldiae TaxID=1073996 RepID=A0A1H6V3Z5_9EURY|nr:NAD-dependent epimerase/dehydratase family protein [Halohasta litchfieldiae]ATW88418.1 nucleoside-diphosphate-sugar epimerase [Halohasta litchfieldiae]SEI94965.1 Nucleoside-diphosphate-sugar epimerase [Halohasta litchfieldiae]